MVNAASILLECFTIRKLLIMTLVFFNQHRPRKITDSSYCALMISLKLLAKELVKTGPQNTIYH